MNAIHEPAAMAAPYYEAAGDEVADAEPLLGKLCMVALRIFGPVQVDWVKGAA